MSEVERKNRWMAVLVITMAVAGFALAGVVSVLPAAGASVPTSSSASAAPAAVNSGPLTQVHGASTGPQAVSPTQASNFAITSDPTAYNASTELSVNIGLNAPGLSTVSSAVSNPASSSYRDFLSFGQTTSFGPSGYAVLVTYLQSYGLTVTGSALSLAVSGTVAQLSAALHTSFVPYTETYTNTTVWNPIYDHVTGVNNATHQFVWTSEPRPFLANAGPVELPSGLAQMVSGITGLDGAVAMPQVVAPPGMFPGMTEFPTVNASSYVPPAGQNVYSAQAPGGAAGVDLATGAANYTWGSIGNTPNSFNCLFFGDCGYTNVQTFFPSTMPTLSGALPLWTGANALGGQRDYGQGVTIAVVEVGCIDLNNLQQYSLAAFGNANQLPDRVTQIALGSNGMGQLEAGQLTDCALQGTLAGWTLETALDIEYAATMAPHAHIDVISVPTPAFTSFDAAYQFIAQYLVGQTQCDIPSTGPFLYNLAFGTGGNFFGVGTDSVFVSGPTSDAYGGSACDVTIASNSYGEGEAVATYEGAPMYTTVEDSLLTALASEGVTSLFASGDSGGVSAVVSDFMPADSPSVTSVGGGQFTALSGTSTFPVSNNEASLATSLFTECFGTFCFYSNSSTVLNLAPVTGLASNTYWAYDEGVSGTFDGIVGGGFGQSMIEPQAWWQNGLDTYSNGARLDPVISQQAGFNMTVFFESCFTFGQPGGSFYYNACSGPWNLIYGGTSFATPISAGELALVEEQALQLFGKDALGNANPLLYAVHNAYGAGATGTNAYIPMQNLGVQNNLFLDDYAPFNSFTWYYSNLSIQIPDAVGHPAWFASLDNPAVPPGWTDANVRGGSSLWNNLQGLGAIDVALFDKVVVGQSSTDHALYNEPFYIEQVGPGGTLSPVTTLTAGTTYTFQVVTSLSGNPTYSATAYSGGANDGTYGGGTTSSPAVSSGLTFQYTPTWTDPLGAGYQVQASTYGYFLVTSSTGAPLGGDWSFQSFAVVAPPASGSLSLCVTDAFGVCQGSSAEVTMFHTYDLSGFYNLQGASNGLVMLNGQPVESAVVTQTSVQTTDCSEQSLAADCTLNPAYYAPGVNIGQFVTDSRGAFAPWINSFAAETFGGLQTEVFTVTATYDGLTSNTVTVYVEPETGTFWNNVALGATSLTGTVQFDNMNNIGWLNASVGSAPGQFVNESFSGVSSGIVSLDLSLPSSGPVVLTEMAQGSNDLLVTECFQGFFGGVFCFNFGGYPNPIVWQDPLVFLPTHLSASQATGTVAGTDTLTWTGTAYAGATGALTLVSGAGTTTLATGVSGTYALDTSTLMDGSYSAVYTETAPGTVQSTASVTFYADNQAASLSALVATLNSELTADQSTIASLQTSVATLQTELGAANADIASLQSQVSGLTAQVTTLQGQLSTAQAQVTSLTAQVASLQSAGAADNATIASLNAQLATAQGTVTADQTQIASLQGQVATLQSELNAQKGHIAPAWYDTFPGGGLAVAILFAAIGAVVAGLGVGLYSRRKQGSNVPAPGPSQPAAVPPAAGTKATTVVPAAEAPERRPEDVVRRAYAARARLLGEGKFRDAERLGEAARKIGELAGIPARPEEFESLYR